MSTFTPQHIDESEFVLELMALIQRDVFERGAMRSKNDYMACFPGREVLVSPEYDQIVSAVEQEAMPTRAGPRTRRRTGLLGKRFRSFVAGALLVILLSLVLITLHFFRQ